MNNKQKTVTTIIFIFLILIAITVSLTIYINENDKQNDISSVRIASLQGPTSIGMIKMIEEKPTINNAQSTYEIVKTTDLLISKLQAEEFDIACLPVNLAANLYNKGIEYELLGINNLNNLYIIGNDSNITNISELKGNVIGVINKGATPDILFNYILNKNNMDSIEDITIDYSMPPAELAAAIIAGKIKYGVLPEPFVSQILSKNKDCKILFDLQEQLNKVNDTDTNITQGCIVVRKEFAKNNKKTLDDFINKYTESIQFVNNNFSEAGAMCEKYSLGVTAETAETVIPRSNIVYISADESKKDIYNFLKILYDFSPDSIGGKIPDNNFYYNK
jgi:NitT/TauT family transport system substrate-binding protein